MDLLDMIYEDAHSYPGGVEALARRMGKNPGTLRKKLLPNEDSHDLTVKELRLMVAYCNTNRVAQGFADDRELMCISKPNFSGLSDQAILDLFLGLQREQGEWSEVIREAIQNGEVDWDELIRIRKEFNDFIVAASEIMSRLESYMGVSEERISSRTVVKNK